MAGVGVVFGAHKPVAYLVPVSGTIYRYVHKNVDRAGWRLREWEWSHAASRRPPPCFTCGQISSQPAMADGRVGTEVSMYVLYLACASV